MPDEKIRAKERKLSEILSGSGIFSIPQFQRAYDWKTDQISQLWKTSSKMNQGISLGRWSEHQMKNKDTVRLRIVRTSLLSMDNRDLRHYV